VTTICCVYIIEFVLHYRKAQGSSPPSKKVNDGKVAAKKASAGNVESLCYV